MCIYSSWVVVLFPTSTDPMGSGSTSVPEFSISGQTLSFSRTMEKGSPNDYKDLRSTRANKMII